jgi:2-polyprenyl-3-methyl-5-hydroxy-6-metoxy-1,4-benzoquinol methylase
MLGAMRQELATVRGGRSGRDVVIAHQLAVIGAALSGPSRILEVGCGRGEVAAGLARAGHHVTAIDPALPDDVMAVRNVRYERVAIEAFSDAVPYDAVAFTASLHHVDRLAPVLDRVAALLAPRGVLVVDDFDLHAPDEAAALWYFELQEILAVALLYDAARIDGKATQPPVARWLAAHAGHAARERSAVSGVIDKDQQLHGKAAMLAAIRERFTDVVVAGGPYLYRYIAAGLRGPRSSWIAEAIRDTEKRRIDGNAMPAVGLQITARRK